MCSIYSKEAVMAGYWSETTSTIISILYLALLGWAWLALLLLYGTQPEPLVDESGCTSRRNMQRMGRFGSLAVAYLSLVIIAAFLIAFVLGKLTGAAWMATP
jgi:hypothetical protein